MSDVSGYDQEVLTDAPLATISASELPTYERVPFPDDAMWTLERCGRDIFHVILSTAGVIRAAYMNGRPIATDHPVVVEITEGWEPPTRWLPTSDTMVGEAALYAKVLTPEQVAAHHAAWDRQ